tara:strand:- start:254906 stop:256390 length:1485 start_codon:yes stop_codon:yes gene_type:complete
MNQTPSANAFGFFLLAAASSGMLFFDPGRPERWFVVVILALVAATLCLIYAVKSKEPKPVNWLTVDVLFAGTFCIVHFGYFVYWSLGMIQGPHFIWNFRYAHVPHTVCKGLAMYVVCLNLFLFGYHSIRTRAFRPIINQLVPPPGLMASWGKVGRLLVRMGFLGFAGYIAIVGPSVVFGNYSGTNNKGFLPNISFQLGQVFLTAGIVTLMVSKQRAFAGRRNSWGIGWTDGFLILLTMAAIGLHGDRSTLVFIMLPILIGRAEYIKPIPLRSLSLMGLCLIILLGLIVSVRSVRDSSYRFDPIQSIHSAFLNLGGSAICGFVAIDYVPRKHDYFLGRMQVLHLMGIVPFSRKLSGVSDTVENSSSALLTLLIQGSVGGGVAGTGTSVFADFYFDFGFAGTAIIFLTAGAFAKWLQNSARTSTSLLWQVAFVCAVAFFALCSRYTLIGGLIRFSLHTAIYTAVIASAIGVSVKFTTRRPVIVTPVVDNKKLQGHR